MRVSVVGTGYVGLVTRRLPRREGPRGRLRRRRRGEGRARSCAGDAADPRGGPRGAARASNVGQRFTRDDGPRARRCAARTLTLIAVGTPVRRQADRPRPVRRRPREIGAALRDKRRLPRRGRQEHGGARARPTPWCCRCSRRPPGKRAGRGLRRRHEPGVPDRGPGRRGLHGARPDRARRHRRAAPSRRSTRLYAVFPDVPRIRTNTRTAEMIKYASNALLATADLVLERDRATSAPRSATIDVVDVMEGVHASTLPHRARRRTASAPRRRSPPSSRRAAASAGSCLPEGRQGADRARGAAGAPMPLLSRGDRGERGAAATRSSASSRSTSPSSRGCGSACSASPSSRTPTTCASRRRPRSSACSSSAGPR